ncbi:flagellar assembly protein FliW [Lentibacillus saliphilus]|uniref:flagellar assembly protein FliW n=1 Tax=Lentibacillus saliphilus TaxID=2737028 RepID=UPI001FE46A19|nr:flagellar assembly protein FliW [Lentibacillus saliphilus]
MGIIKTKYLGEVDVKTSDIFRFKSGLPGFGEETEFVMLDLPGDSAFQIMQSFNTPHLAFIVTNPHLLYQDYEFELDASIAEQLEIEHEADVAVVVIVTLKDALEQSTINLKGPIILNTKARTGKQYILQDETYPVKAPLTPPVQPGVKGD